MTKKKARILLIDNDERALKELSDILTTRHYEVRIVELISKDIVATAATLAKEFRPHVAVVDLRLYNDFMEDRGGLDVYDSMDSAWCILYSAHLTAEVTQDALEQGYYKCIRKGGGSTRLLLQHIEEAAALHSSSYHNWKVPWPATWASNDILEIVMEGNNHHLPNDMLDDIVLQLLEGQTTSLNLDTVEGNTRTVPPTSQLRSFVVKIRSKNRQPKILKLAKAEQANQEKNNYEEFISDRIPGDFHTRLEKTQRFWDMAGTLYSFLGSTHNTTPSFASYYQETVDSKAILKPLQFLFQTLWINYYKLERRRKSNTQSLFALYDSVFGLTDVLPRIGQEFNKFFGHSKQINLLNPGEWLTTHQYDVCPFDIYEAITHGDLHGDNLFVDQNYAWLIDFERTGYGHVLRDFVELESSILTRLIPETVKLIEFQKLIFELAEFKIPKDDSIVHDLQKRPELYKAYQVILGLRKNVHDLDLINNRREYTWSLILNMAKVASFDHIANYQKERALLYCALLCERLRHWNARWSYTNFFLDINVDIDEPKKLDFIRYPIGEFNMGLSSQQFEQFYEALLAAYREPSITRMLRTKCDKVFDHIVTPGAFRDRVFSLIEVSEMEGWTRELIRGAYEFNPGNPKLRAFAQQFLSYQPDNSALEKIVRSSHRFHDIALFREKLGHYENQICSIEVKGEHAGTGFLIAPDVLMTCYHVIMEVLDNQSGLSHQDIRLRFDFKKYPDGQTGNEGQHFSLVDDPDEWLLVYRNYSQIDLVPMPKDGLPALNELDYALLKIQGMPGHDTYGNSNHTRGWINLPIQKNKIQDNAPITVIQHPAGQPLKFASDSFIGFNDNLTRLTYRTNTKRGSSGSPCFDANLTLVALHHSGEPDKVNADYNEGIPIHAIRQDLIDQGLENFLADEWNPASE